jgi:hypothetical protein
MTFSFIHSVFIKRLLYAEQVFSFIFSLKKYWSAYCVLGTVTTFFIQSLKYLLSDYCMQDTAMSFFVHSLPQETSIECLLCARHCGEFSHSFAHSTGIN